MVEGEFKEYAVSLSSSPKASVKIQTRVASGKCISDDLLFSENKLCDNDKDCGMISTRMNNVKTRCMTGTNGVVTPSSLEFTSKNWRVPQVIQLRAFFDDIVDGDSLGLMIEHVSSSTDSTFDGLRQPVKYDILDGDASGLYFSKNIVAVQEGERSNYEIKLTSKPVAPVNITIQGTIDISPSSLVFSSKNWNQAQQVTLAPKDDSMYWPLGEISILHINLEFTFKVSI